MIAGSVGGRYTLGREIGRGGMGAVWLGRDEVLGRTVALKRVGALPGAGSPDLARAEREARLAARVNHPHVVAVFDLVVEDDEQWLVMEHVDGTTLAEVVRRHGALAPDEAAPLLAQAADALAAAHRVGIVHRDVKPSNILVTDAGQVKLTDFGIARAHADASLTQTGLVTGSPAYLAPEVASGASATEASDVWSLGATLFHTLAGHPPYEVGDNVLGALYRIVHEEPPRLDGVGRLAPLLEGTLCKDPQQRWSMDRVRDVLLGPADSSIEATTAVPAVPPPRPAAPAGPREDRESRRGRLQVLAVAAAVAVVALLTALAFALGLAGQEGADPRGAGDSTRSGSSGSAAPPGTDGSDGSDGSGPTAGEIEGFVADYLRTAAADPAAAFDLLTPAFQQRSGGLAGYQGFWGDIAAAELLSVAAHPGKPAVTYRVRYTRTDGSTWTDPAPVRLDLDYRDGRFLISGES